MKLKHILNQILIEALKAKESFFGGFKRYDFYDMNNHIGYMNIRLKKNWNQAHIEVFEKYQRKGYSIKMFDYIIKKHDYITIPEARIVNPLIKKVINKLKRKYEVFKTKYDEWVISNKKKSKEDILKILT